MHIGNQSDIRQLGHAVDEDDVGRLDIAVNQTVFVQGGQGLAQSEPSSRHCWAGSLPRSAISLPRVRAT